MASRRRWRISRRPPRTIEQFKPSFASAWLCPRTRRLPADWLLVTQVPSWESLRFCRQGSSTVFDLGEWRSSVASRKNDDGTISFMTIDPGGAGFEFVESKRNDKRALIVREGQHEYIFTEAL